MKPVSLNLASAKHIRRPQILSSDQRKCSLKSAELRLFREQHGIATQKFAQMCKDYLVLQRTETNFSDKTPLAQRLQFIKDAAQQAKELVVDFQRLSTIAENWKIQISKEGLENLFTSKQNCQGVFDTLRKLYADIVNDSKAPAHYLTQHNLPLSLKPDNSTSS